MEVESMSVQRHCEPEFFEPVMEKVREYDMVLSTACGVGVNYLAEHIGDIQVCPGLNTSFYGTVTEPGVFEEVCVGCGDCILHLTGGVCPIARCSKTLMNGPCGGTRSDGTCEVDEHVDCVWNQIVERAEARGELESLVAVRATRDWSNSRHGGPKRVVREDLKR